jgi:hypothetical protein
MATSILGLFGAGGKDDPLADAKALAAWMEKQPANDYVGLQEAMVRLLKDTNARQPKVTPNRVLAVLQLDRISTPIQARLLKHFLQPSLSDSVRQRLWHACDDLARWFAFTYENLFETLQENLLSQKATGQLPGVAARMFYYRGQQAKYGLFRYERWIPGKWTGLHAAYEAAAKHTFARVPFALFPDGRASENCSAEQEYLQILLMQRVNTGNLSALQIEMAALWLRAWVQALTLAEPPLEGDGFWLDLGLHDGLLTRKPQSARGALLYLDIAPLQEMIDDGSVELRIRMQRIGAPVIQAEAAERLALLQRLEQLWRPTAKPIERRGVRVHADRPVHVAAGLVEIAAALYSADPKNAASFHLIPNADSMVFADVLPRPKFGGADLGVIEFERKNVSGWRIHDASESGCKVVSQVPEAAQQKLGGLLGIQDEGDTRWKIGIVRRLKIISREQTELGVEIIAKNCVLIAPKPLAAGDTGHGVDASDATVNGKGLDALYLPPMQSPGRPSLQSIIVPALEYAEHRRFFLNFENTAVTIELTTLIERTKDWVRSGFEFVS